MKDKDILDILINSTKRLTECEIKAIKNLIKENKELKEADLTSVYLDGIFDERARWEKRIKEKIEELNFKLAEDANGKIDATYNIRFTIQALQELLESED